MGKKVMKKKMKKQAPAAVPAAASSSPAPVVEEPWTAPKEQDAKKGDLWIPKTSWKQTGKPTSVWKKKKVRKSAAVEKPAPVEETPAVPKKKETKAPAAVKNKVDVAPAAKKNNDEELGATVTLKPQVHSSHFAELLKQVPMERILRSAHPNKGKVGKSFAVKKMLEKKTPKENYGFQNKALRGSGPNRFAMLNNVGSSSSESEGSEDEKSDEKSTDESPAATAATSAKESPAPTEKNAEEEGVDSEEEEDVSDEEEEESDEEEEEESDEEESAETAVPTIKTLPGGVLIETVQEGEGEKTADIRDIVETKYELYLVDKIEQKRIDKGLDPKPEFAHMKKEKKDRNAQNTRGKRLFEVLGSGESFDPTMNWAVSSADSGEVDWVLGTGGMIRGYDLAVRGMKLWERRKIFIPAVMAYGKKGARGKVPPNADLLFDCTLVKLGIDWKGADTMKKKMTAAEKARKNNRARKVKH